jgi:hypothetical protein
MTAATTAPPMIIALPPDGAWDATDHSVTSPVTTPLIMAPRDLVSPVLFDKLTFRIMTDHALERDTAERVVAQSLAFLVACALRPNDHLSPSKMVDVGWHAFILHTVDYAEFCDRVAGRFIHHHPTGPGEADGEQQAATAITVMHAVGLYVDTTIWNTVADCTSDCHQCHAGCHDSPGRT